MIQIIALLIILAACGWLAGVALLCAASPERALHGLSLFASSSALNLAELCIRAAVGAAMALRAPASINPEFFAMGGWFLIISAVVIGAVPRRWHAGFAVRMSQMIPRCAVRYAIAPLSMAGAIVLAWAAL